MGAGTITLIQRNGAALVTRTNITAITGCSLLDRSYKGFAQIAPLKRPRTVDWFEENGVQVDLSEPKLVSKEIKLEFVSRKGQNGYETMISILETRKMGMGTVYVELYFNDIEYTRRLRYVSNSITSYDANGEAFTFSVTLLDEFEDPEIELVPKDSSTGAEAGTTDKSGYLIDGIAFSNYGIQVLDRADFLGLPKTKKALLKTAPDGTGKYDYAAPITVTSYDATMSTLFIEKSAERFWANRADFVRKLKSEGTRALTLKGIEYTSHYVKSNVQEFSVLESGIWCKMAITFCIVEPPKIVSQ